MILRKSTGISSTSRKSIRQRYPLVLIALFCLSFTQLKSPVSGLRPDHFTSRTYACVSYDKNEIIQSENLEYYHKRLDVYLKDPRDKVRVVHIGDSHIQADILTDRTRLLLQRTFGNGGRGFVFPYRIIHSNGPDNLHVVNEGNWQGCKSVNLRSQCNFGICGASATTYDSLVRILLNPNKSGLMNYEFNKIRMFHLRSARNMNLRFTDQDSQTLLIDEQPISRSVSDIYFNGYQDSVTMVLERDSSNEFFQLFGMSIENSHPGIVYHSIGLNGAYAKSYLRNQFFEEQLAALEADLIIVSLGTNDGYMPDSRFCKACFQDSYRALLKRIRTANPNASILLTTPGDYYRRRRYHNSNNENVRDAILELSKEFDAAVWDFNRVMGGNYAIRNWVRNGLARADLVHYTRAGYELQGELLYEALMQAYESRFE